MQYSAVLVMVMVVVVETAMKNARQMSNIMVYYISMCFMFLPVKQL